MYVLICLEASWSDDGRFRLRYTICVLGTQSLVSVTYLTVV